MNKRIIALLAATATEVIYGINHTIAKELMPQVIEPYGFILLRVGGAAILFWTFGLFTKMERIDTRDWLRIFGCEVFGMFLNMLLFFKGFSLLTTINSLAAMTVALVLFILLTADILTLGI